MFTAAQSTKARKWKPPRCPSTDEYIKKLWCMHSIEYYLDIKRNELEPFFMR